MMTKKILIALERCTHCQACVEICPRDCFHLEEEQLFFDGQYCHDCGHCISICPTGALTHQIFPPEDFSFIEDVLSPSFFSVEQLFFFLQSVRSTRAYKKKSLKPSVLQKLVEIVRFAPTGHHSQNVELIVVQQPETIEALKRESAVTIRSFLKKIDSPVVRFFLYLAGKGTKIQKARKARSRFVRMLVGFEQGHDYLFHGAPAIFIFHANSASPVPADNCNQAASYVRLVAHSLGLGSCFIGYLTYFAKYNKKIKDLLHIPRENEIYQVLILGYPKYRFKTFVSRKPSKVNWL